MTDLPTPVHMAGVATGQLGRTYLLGALTTVLLEVLVAVMAAFVLTLLNLAWPGSYIASYAVLVTNAVTIAIMALVMGAVHQRPLSDLIAPGRRLDWGIMGRAALIYALPWSVQVVQGVTAGELVLAHTDLSLFLILAPVSILLFGLQSTAEELVFRGYLTQAGQVWFRHAVPTALMTGLLFTLVHEGVQVRAVWEQRAEIMTIALFLSWMTVRLGRLEAAMGVHIINNVLFSFFIGGAQFQFPDLTTRVDLDPPDPQAWAEWGEFALQHVLTIGFFWLAGMKTGFIERGFVSFRRGG